MDDLISNKSLNENTVLHELKERYKNGNIYTYAGETLLKVIPCKELQLHGKNVSEECQLLDWQKKSAHLFALADVTYQGIVGKIESQAENQCIIIRGVSGSGKTEAAKQIIQHLVTKSCQSQLQKKILSVHSILEAFGNARTVVNANASRFGLLTTLYFRQGKVEGVRLNEYFLERWRVTNQLENESNFHIFYYVLAEQSFDPKKLNYRYLQNCPVFDSNALTDLKNKCMIVTNAFNAIGFSHQELENVNILLLSILYIGNISIQKSLVGEAILDTASKDTIQSTADILGLDSHDLEESIICRDVIINGEKVQRHLTRDEAEDCREALARMIYQRLFGWIIFRINCLLVPDSKVGLSSIQELGILDFSGFEDFPVNSFEQCYINLTDEFLHGLYCKHVFRVNKEECQEDGVTWTGIESLSNDDIVDLYLAKPWGLLTTLEEATQTDKENNDGFILKLSRNMQKNPLFQTGASSSSHLFSVIHYMGKVTYDARGWVHKNQYLVSSSTVQMMQNAENSLLSTLFNCKISSSGTVVVKSFKSSKKVHHPQPKCRSLSVTAHFKSSMQSMLDHVRMSNLHFICCIKPSKSNNTTFEDEFVRHQLKSLGIIEAAHVYRDGFALSVDHQNFCQMYQDLVNNPSTVSPAEKCQSILSFCKLTGWQIGKSKVFLKACHVRALDEQLAQKNSAANQNQTSDVYSLIKPVPDGESDKTSQYSAVYSDVLPKSKRGQTARTPTYCFIIPGRGKLYPSLEDELNLDKGVSSDSDFEVLDEEFVNIRRQALNSDIYGEIGTKEASINWFKITQANDLKQDKGGYFDWCHGMISRKNAEDLLRNKAIGYFLIRLSESRFGYTLSIKDNNRCRHYMIDQLCNSNFRVTGEVSEHKKLNDLVNYYRKNKLSNWNGLLTIPCGQLEGHCDYLELVLEKEDKEMLEALRNKARLEPTAPNYQDFSKHQFQPSKQQVSTIGSPSLPPRRMPLPSIPGVVPQGRRKIPVPSPPLDSCPPSLPERQKM